MSASGIAWAWDVQADITPIERFVLLTLANEGGHVSTLPYIAARTGIRPVDLAAHLESLRGARLVIEHPEIEGIFDVGLATWEVTPWEITP